MKCFKKKKKTENFENSFRSNMARNPSQLTISHCNFRLKSNCPSIFTEVMIERCKNLLVTAWSLLL